MGVEKRPRMSDAAQGRNYMKYDPYCGANLGWRRFCSECGGEPADAGRLNEGSNIEPVKKIYAVIGNHAADYHAVVVAMCFVNRSYK